MSCEIKDNVFYFKSSNPFIVNFYQQYPKFNFEELLVVVAKNYFEPTIENEYSIIKNLGDKIEQLKQENYNLSQQINGCFTNYKNDYSESLKNALIINTS